jgi:chromosome segregation ATPase
MELYNYTQGGTLENLKHENSLEKSQVDQLMLKLREKENIQEDLEKEINEISETVATLNRKLKELEDRNAELEKEYKPLKK